MSNDVETRPILAALRALRGHVAAAGGDLHAIHLGGTGTQAVVAELNEEQGRDIDPPPTGQELPPGTDMSRVKFRDASVVVLDGDLHVHKGERRRA